MEMYDSNGNIIKGILHKRDNVVTDFKTLSRQLDKLEQKLHLAVDIEDYEQASVIRDKIIEVKRRMLD